MNKQQLAQKMWASANQMRSKIEANEYKDYMATHLRRIQRAMGINSLVL